MFKKIALAKEIESPENPGALEERVALTPADVKKLVDFGLDVFVELGAGERIGFADEAYQQAGATLQESEPLYRDKDLIIKFKGPALHTIDWMRPGTTLFCMAHFHSFPDRAKLLKARQINVIAMENIVHAPYHLPDHIIMGRMAADNCLEMYRERNEQNDLHVRVLGFNEDSVGAIRRLCNESPKTMAILPGDSTTAESDTLGPYSVYIYDSQTFVDPNKVVTHLIKNDCHVYDLRYFINNFGANAINYYRQTNPPPPSGLRRIQCLHETGRAGARYGLKLVLEHTKIAKAARDITVVVLGYGNVGMGAIHECWAQGVKIIHILGRRHTRPHYIDAYLAKADLVINGAEQPIALRGKNFLITREHTKNTLRKGSVVIDLVGGSATNRSAVENVIECTYKTDPHFEEDGVVFSALWGWPMMGMAKESAIKYGAQITEVLIEKEMLINGLDALSEGVKPALVCGPFEG